MAQATTLSDLYAMIQGEVNGCPNALITQHLQQALRKFCEETEAFTEKLAAINLVDEDVTYVLTPAHTSCEIRRILKVWIRTATDVTNGDDGTLLEYDDYEFDPVTKTLTLDDSKEPTENVTGGLVVEVVLVPFLVTDLHATTAIPAAFLNLWAEAVMAFAKYTLMRMPRKSWTNPELAMLYLAEYRDGVSRAKTETEGLQYRHEQGGFGA
jgi:hypothetical protein